MAHSLSPALYRAAFDFLGVRATYRALRVPAGDPVRLRQVMRDLAASGGGNVTVPHKIAAVEALEVRMPAVRATGACNCFCLDGSGRLTGDNTDVQGFLSAWDGFGATSLAGSSVLLLGAGGAARAVAAACARIGVGSLEILNRSTDRARRMVRELGLGGWAAVVPERGDARSGHDLVVNATSLGLHAGDPLPVQLDEHRFGAVVDLVYGRGGTAWTRKATELGLPAMDGRRMLVHQAALSLEAWGIEPPDREAVLRAMLDTADARLATGAPGPPRPPTG